MIKTLKIRLNPNNKQQTKLFQYAGAARFAYNWALSREEENHKQGNSFLPDFILRKEFTQLKKHPDYLWLNTISNNVTKQAIKDACKAYQSFFRGQTKHPRFKNKKKSTPAFYQDNVKIRFTGTHVKVEGFAISKKANKQKLNWIRLCEKDRIPIDATYTNPRFTFDGLYWSVSVGIEQEEQRVTLDKAGIGIDVGLKMLAVCSDGYSYNNINKTKTVKQQEKKKRRLQRSISRKYETNKKGRRYQKTRNLIKSESKLLKVNKRLTNLCKNHLHQTTSDIIKRKPSFICIEDLNVSGMMKNKHLSKAIQQQGFYEFRRQLEYKARECSIPVIIADRFFPSSKLCCACGSIKIDLTLRDRTYHCTCGNVIDRDYQAAVNLKVYGENQLQSIA